MRKQILTSLALASSVLLAGEMARAQTAYFKAVTNLAPAAYWPLQETAQPPMADVETNYGSLGTTGNAVYSSTNFFRGRPGPIAGDSAIVTTPTTAGAFLGVPLTSPGVSLPVGAFTVEAWVSPTNYASAVIVGQSGPNPGGLNSTTNASGWVLAQNYLAYNDSTSTRGFSFHVYNGVGGAAGTTRGGAEADAAINYTTNGVWYHLVGIFDGTNCALYINLTNTLVTNQIAMTGSYNPDTWDPLTIGGGRGLNANIYSGGLDEIAIYTNALTGLQVTNHFNAAASGFATYSALILGDKPYMYWHLDAPVYVWPAATTYPPAANYGVLGNVNGIYNPGTLPGVAGPSYSGFGSPSYACAFNGMGTSATNTVQLFSNGVAVSTVVASSGVMITNFAPAMNYLSNNITLAFWFKSSPQEASRFHTMLGRGDTSWRASLNQNGKVQFNPGEGGELTSSGVYNDGQWHFAAGVYQTANSYTNGENFLYIDGILNASATVTSAAGGTVTDLLLGGAPDYTPAGNGNNYNTRFFGGSLAHVAYFTNALSTAQIQSLYWSAAPAPAIQNQPPILAANYAGATNLWAISASGMTNLAYQWYYNSSSNYAGATALTDITLASGTVITGSATATLSAAGLHPADAGYYFCAVTNPAGSVTSILSQLTITTTPTLTAQAPAGAFSLYSCMSTNATVTVLGGLPFSYHWYTNGVADAIAGTNAVYPINDVQTSQSGETYQCIITNLYGSVTSTVATLTVKALPAGTPASPFAANIVALNPAAYYPLQETSQPPAADVETNYGSLGTAGNAVYSANTVTRQQGGATSDGDASVLFPSGAAGRFLAVPQGNSGSVVPAGPFTAEAWVYPNSYSQEGIVAQSGPLGSGGLGASANNAGWTVTENDLPSLNSSSVGWSFHVYNGNGYFGPSAGAEATVITAYSTNQWYHIVGVFDGTNCTLYINGASMTAYAAANAASTMVTTQAMTGTQALDTWDPLTIGCARGLNNNQYVGMIDEVAVYTNALTASQIQAHYSAASGASYASTVLADKPFMYWRMDAPAYTAPGQSTYPTATNYGFLGTAVTTYAADTAATRPSSYGTAAHPGVPGPQFPGMSDAKSGNNNSYGVLINGIGGANGGIANIAIGAMPNGTETYCSSAVPIDLGTNAILSPLTGNGTYGYSVSIWFKANPNDNRYQNIVGDSDSSWRLALNGNGKVNFSPGSTGTQLASARAITDTNWHFVAATWNKTSEYVYVDGILDISSTSYGVTNTSGCTNDIIIGGDPKYLSSGNGSYGGSPGSTSGYAQRNFNGSVAHFAFFTNMLSAASISNLYNTAGVVPTITTQPVGGKVNPIPLYLSFSATAAGSAPLAYQWYFTITTNYAGAVQLVNDGVKYAGVNTTQMTVSNLLQSDSGNFFVVVTNNYGSATSVLASLTINDQPVITAMVPSNAVTLYQGQTRPCFATAASDVPVSYQWYTNGVADASGSAATYALGPVQTAWSGETVSCVVSTAYGTATNNILLTVLPKPLVPVALTNTPFGSNIMALHPSAYWPMHEVAAALPGAQRDIETNYGTLGSIANASFGDWRQNNGAPSNTYIMHQVPGALTGSQANSSALFTGNSGSYAMIPRNSPLTTIKAPFTLEAWVKPLNNSYGIIFGVGSTVTNRGPAANDTYAGFDWNWAGTANTFSLTVRSGPSNTVPGTTGSASTEPKTSASYYPGQWYHVVTTFDGTNVQYFVNGVADSMSGGSTTNATLNPNTWQPLTIGGGRWTGVIYNQFQGYIDELAVYTNVLTTDAIQQHYTDGASASANYAQDVLASTPLLYYRMDSPAYVEPPVSQWLVLTNYGSVGIQGVYRPNAAPGISPGPSASGIGDLGLSAKTALQCDGNSMFADAGIDAAFNPTGKTPFTIAMWLKCNPSDIADRSWQGFMVHSDNSWRLDLNGHYNGGTNAGVGNVSFNAGAGGGTDIGNTDPGLTYVQNRSLAFINDGVWHYVVGTFDGSNSLAYVDGNLVETNLNNSVNLTGSLVDVFLGAYPSTTFYNDVPTATRNEVSHVLAGSICEAAFWNGAVITSNQVAVLYAAAGVPPTITTQPVSANVNQNSAFTNSVTASGGVGPFGYQWYENGLPRIGLTNATMILTSVQPADASANWYVVVTNSATAVTSVVWSLSVYSAPVLSVDISNTNTVLFAGGHASYSVLAFGAVPLTYQWYTNGVAAGGATNAAFTYSNVQPANTTNTVYCVASNFVGKAKSSVATVAVWPLPTASFPATILSNNPFGFWRLNEGPDNGTGNAGVVAYDYWGGNNGLYTNTILSQAGYNSSETNETAAEFGAFSGDSDVYGVATNVDFSAPANSNSAFTITAWAKGYLETVDAGVVSKGYGGGGEQFNLDTGSDGITTANPVAHSYRFFMRDASGTSHIVTSSVNPDDNLWHFLAGVCDETNGAVILYIDGVAVGTNAITPNSGILASSRPMLIGSRPSSATTNRNDLQFNGYVDDVAVFNRALSATDILSIFNAANIPASIAGQPANTTANQNGAALFSAQVQGTPPVACQWYDENLGAAIYGATNDTLVINDVQSSDSYHLVVSNPFGTNQSSSVSLSVASGGPSVSAQPNAQYFVLRGGTISIPATVAGTLAITNQWQISDANATVWTNLTDNSRITGSQTVLAYTTNTPGITLTIANAQYSDAGNYQLVATNASGYTASTLANLIVGSLPISFNSTGIGWTTSGSASITSPDVLTLTDPSGAGGLGSFFLNYPQYIGQFKASFVYQDANAGGADGATFCIQNDTRGAAAIGGAGGSLGVSGISPSIELELNLYNGNSETRGYSVKTNGLTGVSGGNGSYTGLGSVNLNSGDPIGITVVYASGIMSLTFTDSVAGAYFSTNLNVGSLPALLGTNAAYVGFTAAYGGITSQQIITNFSFVSIPTEAIAVSGTNVTVSWPAAVAGYNLQHNADLTTTNWSNVNTTDYVTNNLHQVIIPATATNEFYRLSLPGN